MTTTAVKIVSVGNTGIGKTCTLLTLTNGSFPEKTEQTVFDNYCTNMMVDGKNVSLALWDTCKYYITPPP